MSDTSFGPLRIWKADSRTFASESIPLPTPRHSLLERLSLEEVLRPTLHLRDSFEPLTLAWYQELERLRYHRHGRWIPRLLDFGKYHGERLLGLGSSLGSDLVNYAANGVEVIVASSVSEQLSLVRRNFDLRRLPGVFLHANPTALPIESASVDVVYMNGMPQESKDAARVVQETYRVLKPGGKLLAIVPASPTSSILTKIVDSIRRSRRQADSGRLDLFDRRSLAQRLSRFQESRIYRRHIRRSEAPHLFRWLPLGMLERLIGRLLVFKGFKPVSASRADSLAA